MLLDGYWKDEFQKQIKIIQKNQNLKYSSGFQKHEINKAILLTAIAARKVWEDEKRAEGSFGEHYKSELLQTTISVISFPYDDGELLPPGRVPYHHFKNGSKHAVPADYVINRIIHSYYWDLHDGEKGTHIKGFFVSSEKNNAELYYISLTEWIALVEKVDRLCHI